MGALLLSLLAVPVTLRSAAARGEGLAWLPPHGQPPEPRRSMEHPAQTLAALLMSPALHHRKEKTGDQKALGSGGF